MAVNSFMPIYQKAGPSTQEDMEATLFQGAAALAGAIRDKTERRE
jgi:hypothetical protein